ncbi:hypothetical protein B0I32_1116 [Nonomuraea fuscirosea]|uniref:Uncharacterized protein n=1 Tax=Nonomuraea fuscirosea TaxID=1291556 RepID=A0A2T0MVN5_9ACTN|nr:hypothetical protein B0I32_1116 [Nonomuraea fuscirosea]
MPTTDAYLREKGARPRRELSILNPDPATIIPASDGNRDHLSRLLYVARSSISFSLATSSRARR